MIIWYTYCAVRTVPLTLFQTRRKTKITHMNRNSDFYMHTCIYLDSMKRMCVFSKAFTAVLNLLTLTST